MGGRWGSSLEFGCAFLGRGRLGVIEEVEVHAHRLVRQPRRLSLLRRVGHGRKHVAAHALLPAGSSVHSGGRVHGRDGCRLGRELLKARRDERTQEGFGEVVERAEGFAGDGPSFQAREGTRVAEESKHDATR
ncbi:hypothetical protein H257_13828 [Aphanomyces astaci]|uniref:Uncharacterized protein n=1 Tax=Aphanomyces astaci TaxID=112090 RepID=W4FUV7_APHAT|nr:hypothetical protein H257_13828 [Aphanomyces astaci]ETV70736.1 hypothetical protein H257_13828 [Aphanomyces astaci]|eukprot:XP_009839800.1 hypothetical protein H257_13828 [Aphanomyces astaci]